MLIGPDNGLLPPAADALGGLDEARELTNRDLWLPGHHLHLPRPRHLRSGRRPPRRRRRRVRRRGSGPARRARAAARSRRPSVEEGAIETVVTYVDSFGNVRLAGGRTSSTPPFGALRRWRRLLAEFALRPTALPSSSRPGTRRRSAPSTVRRAARLRRLARQPGHGRQPGQHRDAPRHRPRPAACESRGTERGRAVPLVPDRLRDDTAPAVCRGVIWSILPDARINDLTHASRAFGIRDARLPALVGDPVPAGRGPPGRGRPRRRHRAPPDRARSRRAATASSVPTTACSCRPPSAAAAS